MTTAVSWGEPRTPGDGTVERSFEISRTGMAVPGVTWIPVHCDDRCPLVLLGHGGSGHKRNERIVSMGRWFASAAGVAAVAIDGPYHGDRVESPLDPAGYQRRMLEEGLRRVEGRMVDDWLATIEMLGALGHIDARRLGYVGLSMGTRFGLPLGSRLGTDLRCAVLGKFGLHTAGGFYGDDNSASRAEADARRLSAPTLFHAQWDDEVFPRAGQLALFDALGASDKLLLAYPGPHTSTHPGAPALWCDFVVRHLRP